MNSSNAPRGASWRFRNFLWLCHLVVLSVVLLGNVGCTKFVKMAPYEGTTMKSFVSQNFFSINYPGDWATRDMIDGANLFFADELIFVRIKIFNTPSDIGIDKFIQDKIESDARLQGGEYELAGSGLKDNQKYSTYIITKPNGQRLREFLIYHQDLQLLFVLLGSSRPEDFDEFDRIFLKMFDSYKFQITARIPSAEEAGFHADVSSIPGVWTTFLEGLRAEDYSQLQRACAQVLGSKIIDDARVREVKEQYFPYSSPVYTFVSHLEVRDRLARVNITLRAVPPEEFLRHETRTFVFEGGHWRLLRFERVE